jgi:hypothetical protein
MMEETAVTSTKKSKNILPDTLIRVEIFRKNDKQFDGRLSRQNLVDVWTEALRKKEEDLDGFASIQIHGRALRVNYRLKKAVIVGEFIKKSEFEWECSNGSGCDFFTGKVIGLSNSSAQIGEIVTVCVNRTALEFTDEQIKKWLVNFGKIEGTFVYNLDKLGFKTDEIEVELKLKKHIPEFLPMYGRKIRIFYVGMKRQCNNCFGIGHLRADCQENKKDWFTFIDDLVKSEEYDLELFGEWPDVIKRKRFEQQANRGKNVRGGRGRGRGRGK